MNFADCVRPIRFSYRQVGPLEVAEYVAPVPPGEWGSAPAWDERLRSFLYDEDGQLLEESDFLRICDSRWVANTVATSALMCFATWILTGMAAFGVVLPNSYHEPEPAPPGSADLSWTFWLNSNGRFDSASWREQKATLIPLGERPFPWPLFDGVDEVLPYVTFAAPPLRAAALRTRLSQFSRATPDLSHMLGADGLLVYLGVGFDQGFADFLTLAARRLDRERLDAGAALLSARLAEDDGPCFAETAEEFAELLRTTFDLGAQPRTT